MDVVSDPNVQNVLLGIAANGISALLASSARSAQRLIGRRDRPVEALVRLLEKGIEETSDNFKWNGRAPVEHVCLFLHSPETATIIRQIFAARLLDESGGKHLGDIEREFIRALECHVGEHDARDSGALLFKEVVSTCERIFDRAIQLGLLPAHEAKSALRHKILLEELGAIKQNILFLSEEKIPTLDQITEFETRYRRQVAQRHGDIIPPNFDTARRVPIDQLYVSPNVATLAGRKSRDHRPLTIQQVSSLIHRSVLLGNPGGGKSTFGQKLIHDLVAHGGPRLWSSKRTPILVVLRDYGAHRKEHSESILQFIEQNTAATYQLVPPAGVFEYLLRTGRAFVVFDGLDELLDTRHRQDIAKDIELFCSLFPSCPALVTSRQVGYEQAPLDEERFETFLLEPFTDKQVSEYITKWFDVDWELSSNQRQEKAKGFYRESRIVADLCANPLMLALMCNIYRGENYIPTNRPDVYEKCALMLFERWDKGRGIKVSLPIEASVRPAMTHLAHWIYSEPTLQSGVTEQRLINKTTDYLCPNKIEDRDEAQQAAREFIEFCRGRAWVFTDTGTTKEGDRLYQFTHRTFLEYFAASQLVRTHPTPTQLLPVLIPRIMKREWDVVAQVAFQIQNKNIEGAGDELLLALKSAVNDFSGAAKWAVLSFATRSLEFIVPSPKVCRELTTLIVDTVLQDPPSHRPGTQREPEVPEVISALTVAARENQRTIRHTFETLIVEKINGTNTRLAVSAAELALHFDICLGPWAGLAGGRAGEFWQNFSDRIRNEHSQRIQELAQEDLVIAVNLFWKGTITIDDLFNIFGADAIFGIQQFRVFGFIQSSPAAEWLLRRFLDPDRESVCWNVPATFDAIGAWLTTAKPPWLSGRDQRYHPGGLPYASQKTLGKTRLSSNQVFAIFSILAVAVESRRDHADELLRELDGIKVPVVTNILNLIRMRLTGAALLPGLSTEGEIGVTPQQADIIRRWINRDINFVGGK